MRPAVRFVFLCAAVALLSSSMAFADMPIRATACTESEPNEQLNGATSLELDAPCGGFAGVGEPTGQSFPNKGQQDGIEDLWSVTLGHVGLIRADLEIEGSADLDLFIFRRNALNPANMVEVARSNSTSSSTEATVASDFLNPGTYFIGVSAFSGGSGYVVKATVSPVNPTNLNLTPVAPNEVTLTWLDNSNNENGFAVQRKAGAEQVFQTVQTVGPNVSSIRIPGLAAGTPYVFRIFAFNDVGPSPASNEKAFTVGNICTDTATELCLSSGRFRVKADFRTPQGLSGPAQAVGLTADTGYFWFFNSANIEMVVKVLNACNPFERIWVFAGGLTNVEVDLTVTDTSTGSTRTYRNPQGTAFEPIQDTGAFATCP